MATDAPVRTGLPVNVKQLRDKVAIGILDWENLLAIVNDPEVVEKSASSKVDLGLDEYAALRGEVQRLIGNKASAKAKNIGPYADYIAAGLKGEFGDAWSTPPLTLWCPRTLIVDADGNTLLPLRDQIIAVDAETQLTAMHRIWKNKAGYGLVETDFSEVMGAFEIYWGIGTLAARQIFHDRNLKGVSVDKSLALSMDQRDLATTITRKLVDGIMVTTADGSQPFGNFVNSSKRQVSANDAHWVTLSAVRSMVVTTLLGKSGIGATSGTVEIEDLPGELTEGQVTREVIDALSAVLQAFTDAFATHSAITAPAVLAALGAAAHQKMSWAAEKFPSYVDFLALLSQIHWDREAKYWDGVAAKLTATGALSFAGGVKDSGYRVFEALLNPDSVPGKRIRGLN
ncbi:DNA sulfur modification protein DndB [Nocardia sp. NPDC050630]|uniref:DNA sulfur modification protein DndB n=1 Tax=Nocardia sp. NPDC050630 TaxID=3364321 RepID=UPI0037A8507D